MAISATEKVLASLANELIEEGHKAIRRAYNTRTFQNQTYNLHDSYGCCLFYNGREYVNSRRYVGRRALIGKEDPSGNMITGRQAVDEFFDSYIPKARGFDLVMVAAIFYAPILEKGIGLRHKYDVIVGAETVVEDVARKYKGRISRINI